MVLTLKVFHTGDIHIGMKFNNYGDGVREVLSDARFTALENMIEKSNELNSDIFVVAGDLFNSIQISKRDINRTVKILDKFNGACLLVLPGNHDYDNGAMELWQEFKKIPSEKILLINEERPYHLMEYDLDIVVYPAPCHSKHSKENSLGWIREQGLLERGKYHIGIAHGALEGLSPDMEGNYYYMSMDELNSIPTDIWLIGHTHIPFPRAEKINNHKIYNAGTPEPDGLNYRDEGAAWFITLDDERISAEQIITGNYRFYDKDFVLDSDEDLDRIEDLVLAGNPDKKIVRLNLSGSISKEAYEDLPEFKRRLESGLFHLMINDDNLRPKINEEIIEREFTNASFPYEFLKALSQDEEALQIAYDLLRRD